MFHCRFSTIGGHIRTFLIVLLATASLASAQQANTYQQTNIISDGAVTALVVDPNFVDPWGISIGQEFWINANVSGFDYVSDAAGNIAFKATIPSASGAGTGSPTGTVFTGAPAGNFLLADGHPALFLFCTLDGTISGWNLASVGNVAEVKVNGSARNAIYTDMGLVSNGTGTFILATNFGAGASVEVYDTAFQPANLAGTFTDPNLPAGYGPYAIHTIGTTVYVTYMLRDTTTYTETLGAGNGIVDAYDVNGNFVKRAITGGNLNAPWGMALAPAGFGIYGGDLLVGNFGDGVINVYNPTTYAFLGQITDGAGNPIANPGLWEIVFGQTTPAVGDPNTLYFAAGLNQERDGLFGSIAAVTGNQTATFALTASTGTLSVTAGQSGSVTLSLAPSNGFTGTVSFSCSGLPAGATCSFSPTTVNVTANASAQTMVTFATNVPVTTGPGGYMAKRTPPPFRGGAGIAAAAITPFAALALFGAFRRRRRFFALLPVAILGIVCVFAVVGCGGAGGGGGGTTTPVTTPAGTTHVTIRATAGAVTKTTVISLTVQ